MPGRAYISDEYGDDGRFTNDPTGMTLADLAAFVIGAREGGVPEDAAVGLFPDMAPIRRVVLCWEMD